MAFEDWVDAGEPSLTLVADSVGQLLTGPVRDAYTALLRLQPTTNPDRPFDHRVS